MEKSDEVDDILEECEERFAQGLPVDLLALCRGNRELASRVEEAMTLLKRAELALSAGVALPKLPASFEARSDLHVVRLLASGGQGQVLLVRDDVLKREAALKLSHWSHESAVLRLRKEAEIAARLDHPGIPTVFAAGTTNEGAAYCLMRFIRGGSLQQRIEAIAETLLNGQVQETDIRTLLEAFVHACRTVDFSHSRGIVHCDLKPANILLGECSEAFVIDWGASTPFVDEPHRSSDDELLTVSHATTLRRLASMTGTLCYVSPERLISGARLGPWTDVYSLGAILLGIIRPCANLLEALVAVQSDTEERRAPDEACPTFSPAVREELDGLWRRSCAERPHARPSRASELADSVEVVLRRRSLFDDDRGLWPRRRRHKP